MALAPADRTRLARVLGLLGSPYMGERDAAALAAHRIVSARELTWLDVLAPAAQDSEPPSRRSWGAIRQAAMRCHAHLDLFTPWEQSFLTSTMMRRRQSAKQAAILDELVERVRAAGRWTG